MSSFAERRRKKREQEAKKKILDSAHGDNLERMKEIYKNLKENLQQFSSHYESEIRNNREKRAKFIAVCNKLDIDPIVSTPKVSLTPFRQKIDVWDARRFLQPDFDLDPQNL